MHSLHRRPPNLLSAGLLLLCCLRMRITQHTYVMVALACACVRACVCRCACVQILTPRTHLCVIVYLSLLGLYYGLWLGWDRAAAWLLS
jgi:hypothetical protein